VKKKVALMASAATARAWHGCQLPTPHPSDTGTTMAMTFDTVWGSYPDGIAEMLPSPDNIYET
jgi:hypothetical protein